MIIHLTFDYELFVNENTGDIDNCLIIPTEQILQILRRQKVHAVFFIDMAYVLRIKELKCNYPALEKDYQKFCNQVRQIATEGHEVALHMHPQWFYSTFDGEKWNMDFEHYKLSDMPEEIAKDIFHEGCKLLREISGFEVRSFRAGGFSIQEFNGFIESLDRNNILNDSSALCGEKQLTELQSYDYSFIHLPNSYPFQSKDLKPECSGKYHEYPIATTRLNFFYYCWFKFICKLKYSNKFVRWGNGGDGQAKRNQEFWSNLKRRLISGVRIYGSVDDTLTLLLDKCLRQQIESKANDITLIGHPKLASKLSIDLMESFIAKNRNSHSFNTFV